MPAARSMPLKLPTPEAAALEGEAGREVHEATGDFEEILVSLKNIPEGRRVGPEVLQALGLGTRDGSPDLEAFRLPL